jgi:hypothetical protein
LNAQLREFECEITATMPVIITQMLMNTEVGMNMPVATIFQTSSPKKT